MFTVVGGFQMRIGGGEGQAENKAHLRNWTHTQAFSLCPLGHEVRENPNGPPHTFHFPFRKRRLWEPLGCMNRYLKSEVIFV